MTTTLPRRDEVPIEHRWDLSSIFADQAAWDREASELQALTAQIDELRGKLGDSAQNLLAWLRLADTMRISIGKLFAYAQMSFDVDTSDQQGAALRERAIGVYSRLMSASAFAEPELLALPPERLDEFMQAEPQLGLYRQYLENLQRRRAHVRSGEVEQLLAGVGEPLSGFYSAYLMLADGDLRFADALDGEGNAHQVSRGTYDTLLQSADRVLRKNADDAYAGGILSVENTFGALYAGSVKADVFRAQAANFESAIAASLHESNIPRAVYDNVIEACNRHLPIWHRYWDLRRRALGLEQMAPYDIFAPLSANAPHIPYAQAVEMICAGVAVLGDDYVETARAGFTVERWVDIYPNQGKTHGAYSGGTYGTRPFMLMNYDNSLISVSTLAHELGHSMHSYMTNRQQPPVYSNYALFVAEVASNFNQALWRGQLLRGELERDFAIALIEEAMSNFHRYLFLMPILSQFELEVHSWAEQGEPVTAARMSTLLADLFSRGYGPAVAVDRRRVGVTWAEFPHLYANFYVYQYASGIAAANALADRILQGEAGAVERYRQFLASGSSVYPLDALKIAGIDMTSAEPMDRAFGVLSGLVDRLETLLF